MALNKKAVEVEAINFGDLEGGLYAGGFTLAEGDYVWTDLTVVMHEGFGDKKLAPRLGVMITMVELANAKGEEKKQFYSLGSKADQSFAPDPNTGKGIVAIPGGPSATINDKTNWAVLLKSLSDSGLPRGTFTGDCSVLEGMHVHMMNVPEPAERAGFQSTTGDVQADRKPGQIAIVSEIKDDGKPWEGTGGLPTAGKKTATKPTTKPTLVKKKEPEPEPEVEAAEVDEDIKAAALGAVAVILEKNQKGMPKASLKTGAIKAIKAEHGDDVMQVIAEMFFATDDALESLLSEVGYTVKGPMVKPVE